MNSFSLLWIKSFFFNISLMIPKLVTWRTSWRIQNFVSGQNCGGACYLRWWVHRHKCCHLSTVTQPWSSEHSSYPILDWFPQTARISIPWNRQKKMFSWLICSCTVSNSIYSSNLVHRRVTLLQDCDLKWITADINTRSLNISHCITPDNAVQCFHFIELYAHNILGYLQINRHVNILNLLSE